MFDVRNENRIITQDVVQTLRDYVGVQPDINEQKIKAGWLIAQDLDVMRVVGIDIIKRCVEPENEQDEILKFLVMQACSFYCYARLLKMFQGTLTEGGFHIEKEATDRNTAKSTALEFEATGDTYMTAVIGFLEDEDPKLKEKRLTKKLAPTIRVIGGQERRASN